VFEIRPFAASANMYKTKVDVIGDFSAVRCNGEIKHSYAKFL